MPTKYFQNKFIDDDYRSKEYIRKNERHPDSIVKIDLQKLVKNIFNI